ncbi:MAG: RsmE family RNA methyltransferase [Clostridiaceae bacterium]|nr:16S rRNA (uracil(1498)-N(3))-methyltransferase [Eubacteriales bacterium]
MSRFFVEPKDISGDRACLYGDDVKHIVKVLRLVAGDKVTLCDGLGFDYEAKLCETEKDRLTFELLQKYACENEPACRVTLYQGLPKAGKMELILQKCVELGVTEIAPFSAARSVVRLSAQEAFQKRERYRRIAYEAAKQARRGVVPQIGAILPLDKLDLGKHDLLLIAYEEERERTLKAALREALFKKGALKSVGFIVGPEGGLAPGETAFAASQGGERVTLGKRILRTETAGMALAAMLLYELEG